MECEERGAIWPLEELRDLARVIKGYAIVWNRPSERLGWFIEQIAPTAIERTFAEKVDLRALIDHDPSLIIGRQSAGTLRVAKDNHGLRVEIDPPNGPRGQDIVESVRRRDVNGMSFAFQPLDVTWNEKVDPPVRTVTDMLVREVSVVSFPAYPQTSAEMRSKDAAARQSWQQYQARLTGRTVDERLTEYQRRRF